MTVAPFRNDQNLCVLKDDFSAVFGKHLFKAGVLVSTNESEDTTGGRRHSRLRNFYGPGAGIGGWNRNTGNVLSDFLLKDMTFGFTEYSGSRNVPQRWHDLEFYVADSWKVVPRVTVDYGVRYSLLFNYYLKDDTMHELRPVPLQPGPRQRPLQRPARGAGTNPCERQGFLGGTAGPNRSLQDEKYDAIARASAWPGTSSGTGRPPCEPASDGSTCASA